MKLYDTLGAKPTDAQEEIKKRYRREASKYHPDRHPDKPEYKAIFQEIQAAYDVLGDPERRKRYDETGETGEGHNIEDEAISFVSTMVAQLAERWDYAKIDYVELMRKEVLTMKKSLANQVKENESKADKMFYLINNLDSKDGGLESALGQRQKAINHDIAQCNHGLKVMQSAIDYLEGCAYTGDKPLEGDNGSAYFGTNMSNGFFRGGA